MVSRKIRDPEDVQMSDAAAPGGDPPEAALAAGAGGLKHIGRQTPITPLPRHIKPGLPEYFTTKLTYTARIRKDLGPARNVGQDLKFIVNGIYDVEGDISGQQQPQWRTWFTNIYEYYTVLNCEYNIHCVIPHIVNDGGSPVVYTTNHNGSDVFVLWNDYGDSEPSFSKTFEELTRDNRVKSILVPNRVAEGQSGHGMITGDLTHDDYTQHIIEIKTDAQDDIWTPKGENPQVAHKLRIMPRMLEQTHDSTTTAMFFFIKLVYTVQFKEVAAAYKFEGQS